MFNLENLKSNIYVEIEGLGRKYIENVDYKGNNPDNPFKRCAVYVKDEPSNEEGQWVNVERLQRQYGIEEEKIESDNTEKKQVTFKLLSFNKETQIAQVLIDNKIYDFELSDFFWNKVKYLFYSKNLPMQALSALKKHGKQHGEGKEIKKDSVDEMMHISTNMPINSRTGNFMEPVKKDPITKKDTRVEPEVNFINEEDKNVFSSWWDKMKPEERQAAYLQSIEQNSNNSIDFNKAKTISTLNSNDFAQKNPNDFIQTFKWQKKKNTGQTPMKQTNTISSVNRVGRVQEGQTGIKPDTSYEDGQKIKVSKLDIDMFKNIYRDTKALTESIKKIVHDLAHNNGENYDDLVMSFKREFEPLVVTVQKLPEDTSGLGKENEQPKDEQPKDEPTPEETPTKETPEESPEQKEPKDGLEKDQQDQDNLNEAKRKKIAPKSEKIAMRNKNDRVVWVSRKKANDYRKKGYSSATSIKPSALKKKKAKPHADTKKWQFKENHAPNGDSNIVMTNDQSEFMDELKNVRVVMVKENKKYSVRGNKIEEMMKKGYKIFKENGYPVVHSLYESEVKKIVDDEVEKTLNEYVEKVISRMRKKNV